MELIILISGQLQIIKMIKDKISVLDSELQGMKMVLKLR